MMKAKELRKDFLWLFAKKTDSPAEISYLLKKCILHHPSKWTELVFLCIGSDRVTGDCLGPYIGHSLSSLQIPGIFVYGTLSEPVHALNLKETDKQIRAAHPSALVIAIDAALGTKKHLGYVTIGNGALYPGAGVQKELHITGIVNISGFLEQMTLQSTRLSTVIFLGDTIIKGITGMIPAKAFTRTL